MHSTRRLGLVLCLAFPTALYAQEQRAVPHSLVRVDLAGSGLSTEDFQRLDFDLAAHHVSETTTSLEVLCDAADLMRLSSLGVAVSVVHEDLAAFYEQRARDEMPARAQAGLGAWLVPAFGSGSMGGFYTLEEIVSVLDQITAAYPTLTTSRFSIGTSIQGRNLWAVKISDNPDTDEAEPEVRFDALHHAREPQSMQTTIWMMLSLLENYGSDPVATYLVDEREMWFLPCVNPDGYVYNQQTNPNGGGLWRKNRRNNGGSNGVDLNRNYAFKWGYDNAGSSNSKSSDTYRGASPASEPEVAAMQAFIDSRNFATALSTHSYSNLWLSPWGYVRSGTTNVADYDEVSVLATAVNGYTFGPASVVLYSANGVTVDYDHGVHGTMSWTPEIGNSADGFWPSPARILALAAQNEASFRRTALAAGADVRALIPQFTDLGDGDGYFEPGEDFEVAIAVRNSGRASAVVAGSISSSDPSIIITTPTTMTPVVGSFSGATSRALPMRFSIDPNADTGVHSILTISITYEGYTQSTDHRFVLGDARAYVIDSVESDLGWIVGDPLDTATTGLWEWGNPVGTSSNGSSLNPEDDSTPGFGVNCFTTGNGSTSASGDDVDNGLTTLVSPAIDLSGVQEALISYRRWFALRSARDDTFQVSISDNDGVNWLPLETVDKHTAQWTEFSFFASEYINLTDKVRLRFVAEDSLNTSLVEAAVDDLQVSVFDSAPRFNMYGTPAIGTPFAMHLTGDAGDGYVIFASPNTAFVTLPNVEGPILISPTGMFRIAEGVIPPGGTEQILATLPNEVSLVGHTFYCQGLTTGASFQTTNRAQVTFE